MAQNKKHKGLQVNKNETPFSKAPSALRTFGREIYNDPVALVSFVLFWTVIIGTLLWYFTIDSEIATRVYPLSRDQAPSAEHILGTDPGGRDMVDMLVLGAGNSFIIAFAVTVLSGFIGIVLGLVSGFYGGHIDNVIMRIIDTWLMLPFLMIVIVLVRMMPGYTTVHFVLIMTAFTWMGRGRIVRAKALQQSKLDYVAASKTLGTRNIMIMIREVLPNMVSVITVNMTLSLAMNMGIETGLTFLGFGLPVHTPSLGTLISYAIVPATLQNRTWQWLPAALLIVILMLCIYNVGQALSRAADVKQRRI